MEAKTNNQQAAQATAASATETTATKKRGRWAGTRKATKASKTSKAQREKDEQTKALVKKYTLEHLLTYDTTDLKEALKRQGYEILARDAGEALNKIPNYEIKEYLEEEGYYVADDEDDAREELTNARFEDNEWLADEISDTHLCIRKDNLDTQKLRNHLLDIVGAGHHISDEALLQILAEQLKY